MTDQILISLVLNHPFQTLIVVFFIALLVGIVRLELSKPNV